MSTLRDGIEFQRAIEAARKRFFEEVLPRIEQAHADGAGLGDLARGKGRELTLEIHSRQFLIDPLLEVLGWRPTDVNKVLAEAPNQRPGQRRRFMDYHGFEVAGGNPLLLVEAKRLSSHLPRRKGAADELPSALEEIPGLLARALANWKTDGVGAIALPGGWPEWIGSLGDYVKGLRERYGQAPARVVITNGDWYVVFEDPEDAFIRQVTPSSSKIRVFGNLDHVITEAESILKLLAYPRLSSFIPVQHPAQLPRFVEGMAEVPCAYALHVYYDSLARGFHARPRISVSLGLIIRSSRGAWVLCEKDHEGHYFELANDPERMAETLRALGKEAQGLLGEVQREVGIHVRLLSAAEFRRQEGQELSRRLDPDHFLLVTGQTPSWFVEPHGYRTCPYHHWTQCYIEGDAAGQSGIMRPSLTPRAYFPSGNAYHCAHQRVHGLREDRCLLAGFETFFCCRACAFFDCCWQKDVERLPCRQVP